MTLFARWGVNECHGKGACVRRASRISIPHPPRLCEKLSTEKFSHMIDASIAPKHKDLLYACLLPRAHDLQVTHAFVS